MPKFFPNDIDVSGDLGEIKLRYLEYHNLFLNEI